MPTQPAARPRGRLAFAVTPTGHAMHRTLLAAAFALSTVPAMTPARAADVAPANAEWQELVVAPVTPGSVGNRYQALLTAALQADADLYGKRGELKEFLASDEFRYGQPGFRATDGGAPVEWHFQRPDNARWPNRAIRMQFLEGMPYRVQVEVHCDDTVDACAAFLDQTRRMRAPQPPFPASTTADMPAWEAAMRAWRNIVVREACEPGVRHVPPPRYPQSALRQGITGKVVLNLLANPCGEVRDAFVEVSSGSRELDRAALDVVREWRIAMPADVPAGSGARLRVPITFDDGDPGEAAPRTAPGKSAQ